MKLNVTRADLRPPSSTMSGTSFVPVTRVAETRIDRIVRAGIVGSGVLCFVLLAWGHLGLGALLFPPAATAPQQLTEAGPYRVTFQSDSGQLTVRGPNTVSFILRDQAGKPITTAAVHVRATMSTMAMDAPPITLVAGGDGRYSAHPVFGMAGNWRLDVTISQPGQSIGQDQHTTFAVSVRWN